MSFHPSIPPPLPLSLSLSRSFVERDGMKQKLKNYCRMMPYLNISYGAAYRAGAVLTIRLSRCLTSIYGAAYRAGAVLTSRRRLWSSEQCLLIRPRRRLSSRRAYHKATAPPIEQEQATAPPHNRVTAPPYRAGAVLTHKVTAPPIEQERCLPLRRRLSSRSDRCLRRRLIEQERCLLIRPRRRLSSRSGAVIEQERHGAAYRAEGGGAAYRAGAVLTHKVTAPPIEQERCLLIRPRRAYRAGAVLTIGYGAASSSRSGAYYKVTAPPIEQEWCLLIRLRRCLSSRSGAYHKVMAPPYRAEAVLTHKVTAPPYRAGEQATHKATAPPIEQERCLPFIMPRRRLSSRSSAYHKVTAPPIEQERVLTHKAHGAAYRAGAVLIIRPRAAYRAGAVTAPLAGAPPIEQELCALRSRRRLSSRRAVLTHKATAPPIEQEHRSGATQASRCLSSRSSAYHKGYGAAYIERGGAYSTGCGAAYRAGAVFTHRSRRRLSSRSSAYFIRSRRRLSRQERCLPSKATAPPIEQERCYYKQYGAAYRAGAGVDFIYSHGAAYRAGAVLTIRRRWRRLSSRTGAYSV
ncbi:unnamed protein product [Acanthosepion pharaonis]|uniref:Uncharacterized protein n=1 Tax=Acanthosepion pharaonis TaxID=158019 RepID=A0A812AJR4_ACAPH|nr:unnamed protein product [Sepia pharaonis]